MAVLLKSAFVKTPYGRNTVNAKRNLKTGKGKISALMTLKKIKSIFLTLRQIKVKEKIWRETVENMEALISGPGQLHLMYALRRMREVSHL